MTIRTSNTAESIDSDLVRYSKIKKKGYVRLETNMGTLNLELRCDRVPKTCENFLKHCASGYYVGTIFHRSIRNFMIQGGDPTGTGKGDAGNEIDLVCESCMCACVCLSLESNDSSA